jgi:hypothetical protein
MSKNFPHDDLHVVLISLLLRIVDARGFFQEERGTASLTKATSSAYKGSVYLISELRNALTSIW